jgi:hypothetical protein
MNILPAATALAILTLLAACDSAPDGATVESAALDSCRAQAEAARVQPEGRTVFGIGDYHRHVAECLSTRPVAP